MKNLIPILTAASMLAVGTHKAAAHDGGWAAAGAVLGGVAVGSAIAAAVTPHPVYYSPPVRYYAPAPVYYAPRVRYYYRY